MEYEIWNRIPLKIYVSLEYHAFNKWFSSVYGSVIYKLIITSVFGVLVILYAL